MAAPEVDSDSWRRLLPWLQADRPVEEPDLYVEPKRSAAAEIAAAILAEKEAHRKFLLVGAKGSGKSTELRRVAGLLAEEVTLASVDLDASAVSAAGVTAFDLLYACGLALLHKVHDPRDPNGPGPALFHKLRAAYARDEKDESKLGEYAEVLDSVASIGIALSVAATAAGAGAAVPIVAGAYKAASSGLKLLCRGDVVAESSPSGNALLEACHEIAMAVRASIDRPIVVILDGLEKMNGQANTRLVEIFQQTALLARPAWTAVIAAPPATLARTNALIGYQPQPVWGFGPDDLGGLRLLLERRIVRAGLDPALHVERTSLDLIADKSGGLPYHAVSIAQGAAVRALGERSNRLSIEAAKAGVSRWTERLVLGLTEEDLEILSQLAKRSLLAGKDRAASLFSDGRIVVHPPAEGSVLNRFIVHPCLEGAVDEYRKMTSA